jgi:hypothetical protein
MRCISHYKLGRVNAGKNPLKGISTAFGRSMSAMLVALSLAVLAPPVSNRVQANTCGDLSLFAFPLSPKQGDSITIFVSVMNSASTDVSFVVDTKMSDPNSKSVGVDDQVILVPAQSSFDFQVTLSTSTSNTPGTYTVVTQSYQGNTLPVCANCFCSATRMQFSLGCNSNNCSSVD